MSGLAINAQVRAYRPDSGKAGSPTANELRHRLSPTHWPQHNTAYRTNETPSPQIRGVTAYTGIAPNPCAEIRVSR